MRHTMKFRDFLALPLFQVSRLFLILTHYVGGVWTAKRVLEFLGRSDLTNEEIQGVYEKVRQADQDLRKAYDEARDKLFFEVFSSSLNKPND